MRHGRSEITTSLPVKPLTDSLKTAVKVMGAVLVGSACPAAWLIVTVGGGSNVAVVRSEERRVGKEWRAGSVARPAGNGASSGPAWVRPVTASGWRHTTSIRDWSSVLSAAHLITTSLPVKPLTDSLKTAVKVMGAVLVGSACPAAWLIVTVGGGSNVTVLSVLVEAVFPLRAAALAPAASHVAIT